MSERPQLVKSGDARGAAGVRPAAASERHRGTMTHLPLHSH